MSIHTDPYPIKNRIAITSVEKAIRASDTAINIFLLYLSAQTPANGDNIRFGANPHIMDSVIMTPDRVSRAMYQVIAYWTREEPNNDIVWLARKSTVFFFQLPLIQPPQKCINNTGQLYHAVAYKTRSDQGPTKGDQGDGSFGWFPTKHSAKGLPRGRFGVSPFRDTIWGRFDNCIFSD